MSQNTILMCGIVLLTIPTIMFGGNFLMQILSGKHKDLELTPFQKSMFRSGHAHAGVIVLLSLFCEILIDYAGFSPLLEWSIRIGFPMSAILISGGFFGAASGKQITKPTKLIIILYTGVFVLFICILILGIALIRAY